VYQKRECSSDDTGKKREEKEGKRKPA